MREVERVDWIRRLSVGSYHDRRMLHGIGDDCAIMRPLPGEDLVFTCDSTLEGRHFALDTHSAADVGHKALARSLSDLAAMGSEPVFCLVSLALPSRLAERWLKDFYKGLLRLAQRYKIMLAGGDLAQFEKVVVDVTCGGRVPRDGALLRGGAKAGDLLYVSGQLGGSSLGFRSGVGAPWRRHKRPEPRIPLGVALRRFKISSCMDVSDGLSLDLFRLCRESNVGAEIQSGSLPIARGATLHDALHGGEDYELLFTASAKARIPPRLASLPVSRIGVITKSSRGRVCLDGQPLQAKGFDHFA